MFFSLSPNDLRIREYEYNAEGTLTLDLFNEYKAGKLEKGGKTIKVFDSHSNLLSTTFQQNRGGQFFNTYRTLYTYDEAHQLIETVQQDWVYIFPKRDWQNTRQQLFEYNANGQVSKVITNQWSDNEWVTQNIKQSTYNENGDLTYNSEIYCNETGCKLSREAIYEYDGMYNLVFQATRGETSNRAGQFIDSTLTEFSYHTNGQLAYQKDSSIIRDKYISSDTFMINSLSEAH